LKIRHGAILDNIVNNLCAKFKDDRLWNENALVHWKSDHNNSKNKKNNVSSAWRPVSRSKNTADKTKQQSTTTRPKKFYWSIACVLNWPLAAERRQINSLSSAR